MGSHHGPLAAARWYQRHGKVVPKSSAPTYDLINRSLLPLIELGLGDIELLGAESKYKVWCKPGWDTL